MTAIDWLVTIGTIVLIVAYGAWRTRGVRTMEGYLRGDNDLSWTTVGLSVMATQASAITFLSTPGQGYEDGLRFVQFYLGLPIAMVLLSALIVPRYFQLRVLTAYEYLERRFDKKNRQLAALLFLVQRGLAAGITLYAPAIILSAILDWPLRWTILAMGSLVIVYTVSGGTKAVSQTQKHQMVVMLLGMVLALILVLSNLPNDVSITDALRVAAVHGKLNAIDFGLNLESRYTFWSGITGGLFVAMAYFGTDHSQVQRYLSGKSIAESRLGLLFNGILKVPMQFLILLVGVLVFVFYQFVAPPLFFDQATEKRVAQTEHAARYEQLLTDHERIFSEKRDWTIRYLNEADSGSAQTSVAQQEMVRLFAESKSVRETAKKVIAEAIPGAETKDSDYIFLTFVLAWVPIGLVGLLVAVILCAAMSSVAGELSALGACMTVDFYRRSWNTTATNHHYLVVSKGFTILFGVLAIAFASFASLLDNLIQAVNILGSLFYGTVLGMFLAGFFVRTARATPVFFAAIVSELVVLLMFFFTDVGFLWYNVTGCVTVLVLSALPFRNETTTNGGGNEQGATVG
ncbi:MAG: sodium:solute symporter [Myxococcales bacterium]|nr:sodium:solute symporter [Myxococcales bacterium]